MHLQMLCFGTINDQPVVAPDFLAGLGPDGMDLFSQAICRNSTGIPHIMVVTVGSSVSKKYSRYLYYS
jgi:hypothetical protein